MTNKEQGRFLSEIEMIGEQKEFYTVSLGVTLNPFNVLDESVDETLKNLRIAYNYAFVGCCEKHGVQNIDNIYDDLLEIWEIAKEINAAHPAGLKILKAILLQWLNVLWMEYVDLTRKYAALLAEGKSWAEFKAEAENEPD